MPNPNAQPVTYEGTFSADARRQVNTSFEQCLIASAVPVQATNPTSIADLMTCVIKGGTLNQVGQSLQIWGAGITNLTTTTAALTITVVLGGVTIATIVTGNVAVGALNLPWQLNLICTVASVDAGGNVTLECHGSLSQNLTTTAAAATSYSDTNTAASNAIAAAVDKTLQIRATISAGNAASFVNQRQLIVDLFN